MSPDVVYCADPLTINCKNLSDSALDGSVVPRHRYVQSAFLFTFFVFALTGNLAIIVKLWMNRAQHPSHKLSTVSQLYLQLAFADILAAFCCMLANAILYLSDHFTAGDVVCKLMRFLQKLGLSCSTFIVVAISLDRCTAVLLPLHRIYMQHTVKIMIVVAWGAAVLFSIPQVIIFRVSPVSVDDDYVYMCVNAGAYSEPWHELSYDLVNLTVLYIAPITCITISYVLIFARITEKAKFLQSECAVTDEYHLAAPAELKRTALFLKARKTSLTVSAVVILTFILCWAPLYISLVLHMINKPDPSEDYYYNHAIYFCGLGHSVFNPVIYGLFHVARRADQGGSSCINMKSRSRSGSTSFYRRDRSNNASLKRAKTTTSSVKNYRCSNI